MRTAVSIPNSTHSKAMKLKLFDSEIENSNFSRKVEVSIDITDTLIKCGLIELKGYFTLGEFKCLCEIFNDTIFTYAFNPQISINANVEDSFSIYGDMYSNKWGISSDEFKNKVKNLSVAQCYALITLINEFCNELNQFDKNVLFINEEDTSEV